MRSHGESSTAIKPEDACRTDRAQFDESHEIDDAFVDELGKGETYGGLETRDAERGSIVFERDLMSEEMITKRLNFNIATILRLVCTPEGLARTEAADGG